MGKYDELATKLAKPKKWEHPEAGAFIGGTIREIVSVSNEFGSTLQAVLEDENNTRWSIWLTSVLAREFERQRIGSGVECIVKYLGKGQTKGGQVFKDYAVSVLSRPAGDSDIPF